MGVPEDQARAAAQDEAVIASLIEMADTVIDMATLGGGKIINMISSGSLDKAKEQLLKMAGKNFMARLITALGKYGINIGSEWLEEGTQQAISIANQQNPGQGLRSLAGEAANIFRNALTNPEDENRQEILEASAEGAKIAAMMGGIDAGANAAVSGIVNSHQANPYRGSEQALIQEALELNPDSALAQKMQARMDAGKPVTNSQLVRLVQENEAVISEQSLSAVQDHTSEILRKLGEPEGTLDTVSRAAAKKALGIEMTGEKRRAYRASTNDWFAQKPDMPFTMLDSVVPESREDIVKEAKKNAAVIGKSNYGSDISVTVKDINQDVVISKKGLKHGLDRRKNEMSYVTVRAAEILQNSIKINELTPKQKNTDASYVLIGAAKNDDGDVYVVRSIVNRVTSQLVEMDVLYSINAKKEPAALNAPKATGNPTLVTDSSISIADLLESVKSFFPDIMSEDVWRHFGHMTLRILSAEDKEEANGQPLRLREQSRTRTLLLQSVHQTFLKLSRKPIRVCYLRMC